MYMKSIVKFLMRWSKEGSSYDRFLRVHFSGLGLARFRAAFQLCTRARSNLESLVRALPLRTKKRKRAS